ncbi:MAG: hypothetical protein Q9175_003761 [Cornicularia normoerica]
MWPRQPICNLCYQEYKKTNRAIRALPYGGIFHRACIDHLLGQKDGRCPSCDSSIPAEWNTPHKNDPMKLAGSPCLCHLASKAGTTTKTNTKNKGPSSTSYNILALQKVYKPLLRTARILCLNKAGVMSYDHVKLETRTCIPSTHPTIKATEAVVRWIATAASGNDLGPDSTTWPLRELRLIANTIAKSKTTNSPLRIPYAFQDAVNTPKEITVFYKQHTKIDSIETNKYEKFTQMRSTNFFVARKPPPRETGPR